MKGHHDGIKYFENTYHSYHSGILLFMLSQKDLCQKEFYLVIHERNMTRCGQSRTGTYLPGEGERAHRAVHYGDFFRGFRRCSIGNFQVSCHEVKRAQERRHKYTNSKKATTNTKIAQTKNFTWCCEFYR